MQESFVVVCDKHNLAALGDSDEVEDFEVSQGDNFASLTPHKKKKKRAKSPANKKNSPKTTP